MTQSSFVPAAKFSTGGKVKTPLRLPGHLAVPVIVGLALMSWLVVWQLVALAAMLMDALA